MTTHAQCAKEIRAELKKNFPEIKFKVRSESFAGGNSVRISYTDGVPLDKVRAITDKYQYGSFNGMIDLYEYTNSREDIPQVKFVQASRNLSPEVKQKVKEDIAKKFGVKNINDEQEWMKIFNRWSDQVIWREVQEMTIEK